MSKTDISLMKAKNAQKRGDFAEAQRLYAEILTQFPQNIRAQKGMQALLQQQGGSLPQSEIDALVALYRAGRLGDVIAKGERLVAEYPGAFIVHNILGVANLSSGRIEQAVDSFSQALRIKPDYVEAYGNLGVALKELGRTEEAIAAYRQALKIKPDYVEAYNNLGVLLKDWGHADEAIAAYGEALKIKPDYAEAHNNLGALLKEMGRNEEAIAACQRALQLRPDFAEAHNNLGSAYEAMGRMDEAIAAYRRVLEIRPDYAEVHNNLGGAFAAIGQLEQSVAAFQRGLALKPERGYARAQMLHQMAHLCDWDGLAEQAAMIPELGVTGDPVSPFVMLSLEDAPARHLLRSQRYAADNFRQQAQPVFARPAERPERIRIGYFSADFHNHATMYLMIRLFELHDRERFAVHVYSYGPDSHDEMRQRLKATVDVFHDVRDLGDREVAELARSEGLDIAIDLKGYTQATRLGILAWRPAPVQISYIGYPGSLGTDFIDYIVGDAQVIPPEQRAHYSESVIFMPHSYQVNDDRRIVSDRAMSRAELGLPEDGFVFCSFNNSYKINAEEFAIWMRLLGQVEGSVLWLFKGNEWARANLRKEAEKRGIDPERLVFADRMPLPEHLARQRHADLFLDTFHYNAHTTTSDALWVGLPVVTLQGQGFAARVAGSLLHAVGLPELVTHSAQDYEALALDLARDPQRLAEIRAKLAANRADAPLFDTARFTRDLERAYDEAHALYREGNAPRDIIAEG